MGRTGRWFASEHPAVTADIMTMAKALASGYPLSAVASTREIMDSWPPGAHGTTFGGNPVACAAACATIDAIEEGKILENASRVGRHALARLRSLMETYPFIGDVRGVGLMIGAEFVKGDKSPDAGRLGRVIKACLEKGLVIVECGKDKNIARFMPPLITTTDEMNTALDIFEDALEECS